MLQRIGGVMVIVLASNAVDRRFEHLLCQTKEYEADICCRSDYQATLSSKNKDRLALNQDNVPEWIDMSTRELLFQ